jgi:hypothetical protein
VWPLCKFYIMIVPNLVIFRSYLILSIFSK